MIADFSKVCACLIVNVTFQCTSSPCQGEIEVLYKRFTKFDEE